MTKTLIINSKGKNEMFTFNYDNEITSEQFELLISNIEERFKKRKLDLRIGLDFEKQLYDLLSASYKTMDECKIYVELVENGLRVSFKISTRNTVIKQRLTSIVFNILFMVFILLGVLYTGYYIISRLQ